jgi:hypothetical protein
MEPMTMIALGSAVAGGLSSIFGGRSQSAAIAAQNQQAFRNWIAQNNQKAINNAKSQFESAQAFAQQMKRNEAITKAAWEYEWDAKQAVKDSVTFQQGELSKQLQAQRGALVNDILSRGVSKNSGLYAALNMSQSINALRAAKSFEKNAMVQLNNITKQKQSMLQQTTENVFMPNIAMFDDQPIYGDAGAARTAGMVSGLVQIGGAFAGAAIGSMGSTSSSSPSPAQYSDGGLGSSSNVENFSNTPQSVGSVSGNMAIV